MRVLKIIFVLALIAGCAGAAAIWYQRSAHRSDAAFRTATIQRGDLLVTIGATGTVEPEEVVDVGAQVAGRINSFGTDQAGKTIDYGSNVEEGTVLAQIDQSLYSSEVDGAQAALEQAKAGVERAVADRGQMVAKLQQAQRDWERAKKLGPSDALAQVDYDAYQSAYEVAKANVAVGDASVVQAQRSVAQSDASLQRAKQNLGYCTIVSPVKGVIIDRRVNIGQTVVSSLNAPSLFLIAKDLKRMEIWVAVNEADIGNIKVGQPVTYTVDAFPGETFTGEVGKLRLNATMTQNVVTYTIEVVTDNSSGKLLPYLTANVKFEMARRENVLLAPNAALRFVPQPSQITPSDREESAAAGPQSRATSRPSGEPKRGTLWVQDGQYVKPIHVHLGATDGINTEVQGDELKEGQTVVISEQRDDVASAAPSATGAGGNPFLPQMGRNRRPAGAGNSGAPAGQPSAR